MYKPISIISIEPIGLKTVCDIEVQNDHTYVANGILNHNSDPNSQQLPRVACLDGTELIHTNMGNIPIKELCPKEKGTKINEHQLLVFTSHKRYMPVALFINKGETEMYKVTLEDGSTVKCTMDHIFLTNRGYMKLRDVLKDENIKLMAYDKDEIGSTEISGS